MDLKNEIIKKISELIPLVPDTWADTIAARMGKSTQSVYAYARGDRGTRKGYHKDVLRFLYEIIENEKRETQKLINQ